MNQPDLVRLWSKAWNRIIFAQLAPTTLLITTVALLQFGLADAAVSVRWAAELILLASGILGALAEFTAADEAMGLAKELATVAPTDASTIRIAAAEQQGHLVLDVENAGTSPLRPDGNGEGIGLANVANRLNARFQGQAVMRTERPATGVFRVVLILPAESH